MGHRGLPCPHESYNDDLLSGHNLLRHYPASVLIRLCPSLFHKLGGPGEKQLSTGAEPQPDGVLVPRPVKAERTDPAREKALSCAACHKRSKVVEWPRSNCEGRKFRN